MKNLSHKKPAFFWPVFRLSCYAAFLSDSSNSNNNCPLLLVITSSVFAHHSPSFSSIAAKSSVFNSSIFSSRYFLIYAFMRGIKKSSLSQADRCLVSSPSHVIAARHEAANASIRRVISFQISDSEY